MDEPFVGRTAELAELRRQFELAMAGQGRVVVLEGPAAEDGADRRCLQGWAGRAETALSPATSRNSPWPPSQLAEQSGGGWRRLAALLAGGHADPLSAGSAVLGLLRAL